MRAWLLALVLAAGPALAADPMPSPAGAAHLKAERARAEREFVDAAAQAAGVSADQVRRALPRGPRITDTGRRVVESLEHQTGRPLDAAQRAAIEAADARREAALARARAEAAQR